MKTEAVVIEVRPPVMAADVKYEIFKALERATEMDADNISVEVDRGKVILRGQVTTWAEREEAERGARNTPGVTEVQNEIRTWHPFRT